ncbi:MAG: hypothetical protein JXB00_14020 [Bacteroidales bacterium]|nr:hypothetical protein [Bacteroidales bacterium]
MKPFIPIRTFIMSFCFLFLTAAIKSQNLDFTGTWKLNEAKSEMGEGRFRSTSNQITIVQSENKLTLEKVFVRPSGEEFKSTETYTLDGKECTNTVFGDREKKSTASRTEDGNALIIKSVMVFERGGEQMTVNTSETWSLSGDGKTLTIDYASASPRGERKNKYLYDKE